MVIPPRHAVGLVRRAFAPYGYTSPGRCRWCFAPADATLPRMTMKDFMSLVAIVVGMLLVLVTP